MQKKQITSLLAKGAAQQRQFVAMQRAAFHSSKTANVEVSLLPLEASKLLQKDEVSLRRFAY